MLQKIYSIRDTVNSDVLIEFVRVMIISRLDYFINDTCCISWEVTMDNELCTHSDVSTVTRNTNYKIHLTATLVTCTETCAVQNLNFFGHRLIYYPQRVLGYLSSLVVQ